MCYCSLHTNQVKGVSQSGWCGGGAGGLDASKVWVSVGGGERWRRLEGGRVIRLQEIRDTGGPHFIPLHQSGLFFLFVCF